jgi:hypothetical protein
MLTGALCGILLFCALIFALWLLRNSGIQYYTGWGILSLFAAGVSTLASMNIKAQLQAPRQKRNDDAIAQAKIPSYLPFFFSPTLPDLANKCIDEAENSQRFDGIRIIVPFEALTKSPALSDYRICGIVDTGVGIDYYVIYDSAVRDDFL